MTSEYAYEVGQRSGQYSCMVGCLWQGKNSRFNISAEQSKIRSDAYYVGFEIHLQVQTKMVTMATTFVISSRLKGSDLSW